MKGYGKGAQKINLKKKKKWYKWVKNKGTHVESRSPNRRHTDDFDWADERTTGLKILKIKRDELFAVFNKSL
jgi:hypothetical protein